MPSVSDNVQDVSRNVFCTFNLGPLSRGYHIRVLQFSREDIWIFTILCTQDWKVTNSHILLQPIFYFKVMKKVLSSNLHQIGYIEKRHLGKLWHWRRHVLISNHSVLKRIFANSNVYYFPLPGYLTYIWPGFYESFFSKVAFNKPTK